MKHLLACCCALILLSSCSYVANVRLLTGGEIRRTDYVQVIPFDYRKDLIVIQARLNADPEAREFILDTGAFDSKVEKELADRLALDVVASKTNSTAQGISRTIDVVRIDSVGLGETTAYDIGAGKLTYDPSSASQCIAADGIIGANLMKLAHWKIDYQAKELHFSDGAFEAGVGAHSVSFDRPMLSGTPSIRLEIDGLEVKDVLFDVGYNGGLVLPMALADRFDSPTIMTVHDRSTSGIFGANTDSLVVKELTVRLGDDRIRVPVSFSSVGKALLGNDFLEHFGIIINYDTKTIHLERQEEVHVDSPRTFMVAGLGDSLWVVNRTTRDLGLALGDTLRTVNGKTPADLFSSFCDYFLNVDRLFDADPVRVEKMDGSSMSLRM
ncbi:MAG: aspartyl protease family protein [Rhodothermales bacterium]